MTKVALVDDHVLVRNALANVISKFDGYTVLFQANNGSHYLELLNTANLPDIVLIDINMPLMNGFETALWTANHHPDIKVIALSMMNDERSVIGMLRNGVKGYLVKDTDLEDLKKALDEVSAKGIYINDILYKNIVHNINGNSQETSEEIERQIARDLTEREKEFLRWLCTDMSYKEIAAAMFVSPRTIDGYRDNLFDKLKVASRIGLVLFAIRNEVTRL